MFVTKKADMTFDDATIEGIRSDPLEGTRALCHSVLERVGNNQNWDDDEYYLLLEVVALVDGLIINGLLQMIQVTPPLNKGFQADCTSLYEAVKAVKSDLDEQHNQDRLARMKERYTHAFSNSFSYEFSAGDLEQIQAALNNLRVQVQGAPFLEEAHRQRLLRRLEKLQSELHKKVSDLDRFWGLVGDAGVVLGKFGDDAKPIVDRIRELTGIIWRTQARAEELPSDAPMPLPRPSELDEPV